jgi:hypothetical protein
VCSCQIPSRKRTVTHTARAREGTLQHFRFAATVRLQRHRFWSSGLDLYYQSRINLSSSVVTPFIILASPPLSLSPRASDILQFRFSHTVIFPGPSESTPAEPAHVLQTGAAYPRLLPEKSGNNLSKVNSGKFVESRSIMLCTSRNVIWPSLPPKAQSDWRDTAG